MIADLYALCLIGGKEEKLPTSVAKNPLHFHYVAKMYQI